MPENTIADVISPSADLYSVSETASTDVYANPMKFIQNPFQVPDIKIPVQREDDDKSAVGQSELVKEAENQADKPAQDSESTAIRIQIDVPQQSASQDTQ